MAEIKEPEEIKSEVENTKADINPLDEAVNEKPYSRPNVRIKAEELQNDIPEPSFMPPPLEPEIMAEEDKPKPKQPDPVNPEFNNMSNKDKKASGDHMAKMIMSGYELICGGMNKMMLFSDKKMQKLANSGEVDFTIPIPYDLEGNTITAAQFIQEHNKQQDGVLKVSDEFKDEMMPVLSRVLTKRGIGMTDEQFLIFGFGKDLVSKGFVVYQGIQTMNMMVSTMKEMTEAYRGASSPSQPTGAKNPPPKPEPSPTPEPEPDPIPTSAEAEYEEVEEQPTNFHYTDATQDVADRVRAQVETDVPKRGTVKIQKPKTKKPSGGKGAPKKDK